MRANPQDSVQVKAQLLADLSRLAECLFAGRVIHRNPHEYRIGTYGSISIRVDDGSYFNHENGEGGDLLTLIQHQLKTDFKGALVWARGFVGNVSDSIMPSCNALQRKKEERAALQRDKAQAMLRRSVPIRGTLAADYLSKHRSITLPMLPEALRFIPHAYNHSAGGFHPALIAAFRDVQGEVVAAHCTFLDPHTGNKLTGDGVKSRLIFGPCRGAAIRLAEATHRLALCEGIEDGLSVLQGSPEWPVWVTGGTSNLRAVQIPGDVREVMICADNDSAGQEAANDLSVQLIAEGKSVRIATPPAGVKDFNDLLRMGEPYVR